MAAFRFSSVEDSYAARMGNSRDVGVIGAAVFAEAAPPPPPVYQPPELSRGEDRDSAAPSARSAPAPGLAGSSAEAERKARPGLGTGFGERHESPVVEVEFERASPTPAALLSVRYDDRPGLLALGIDVDGRRASSRDRWLRETAEPFRRDGFSEPPPGWNGR